MQAKNHNNAWHAGLVSAVASIALLACGSAWSQFVPNDQVVSQVDGDLPQPEFDQASSRIIWQDAARRLWIGDVDPDTGDLIPLDGRGLLITTDLAGVGAVGSTPRFTYGDENILMFTDELEDGSFALGSARELMPDVWTVEPLADGDNRWRPNGTQPGFSGTPRIVYNRELEDGTVVVSWRTWNDPATELMANVVAEGGRFLGDEDAVLTLAQDQNSVTQIQLIDTNTGVGQLITSGPFSKINPFIWWAPEVRDWAFVVMLDFTRLQVYTRDEQGDWGGGPVINIPSDKPLLSSPEAFVHNGRSYAAIVTADELGTDAGFPGQPVGDSEVWIAALDLTLPMFRRVDDPNTGANRAEPEPFEITSDVVVFYTEVVEPTGTRLVRRASTGLGPTWGYDNDAAYGGPWAGPFRDSKNCACTPFSVADTFTAEFQSAPPGSSFVRPAMGPDGALIYGVSVPAIGTTFSVTVDTNTGIETRRIDERVAGDRLGSTTALVDPLGSYYLPADAAVSKFDLNGERLWRTPTKGMARGAQFAPDGKLMFFTWNGWAYVVEPKDGTVLLEHNMTPWRSLGTDPSCLTGSNVADCVYLNVPAVNPNLGLVYNTAITADGNSVLQALQYDEQTHGLRNVWRLRSPKLTGLASTPVLSDDYTRLYVQDESGQLITFDALTGKLIWSIGLGFVSSDPPVVNGSFILPGGTNDESADYDSIRLIQDLGANGLYVMQDLQYVPASWAAAGADNRFVLAARDATTSALVLLTIAPGVGIIGVTPWGAGAEPTTLKGIVIREDGWVIVQHWGNETTVTGFSPNS